MLEVNQHEGTGILKVPRSRGQEHYDDNNIFDENLTKMC